MSFKRRTLVLAALGFTFLISYTAAQLFSDRLVEFVVEEMLVQKLPPGADAAEARRRLEALGRAMPDDRARTERYLEISRYLEKVQQLEPWELERLLGVPPPQPRESPK